MKFVSADAWNKVGGGDEDNKEEDGDDAINKGNNFATVSPFDNNKVRLSVAQ